MKSNCILHGNSKVGTSNTALGVGCYAKDQYVLVWKGNISAYQIVHTPSLASCTLKLPRWSRAVSFPCVGCWCCLLLIATVINYICITNDFAILDHYASWSLYCQLWRWYLITVGIRRCHESSGDMMKAASHHVFRQVDAEISRALTPRGVDGSTVRSTLLGLGSSWALRVPNF